MRKLANRLWRRLFGRWSLDDPRPVARSAPYTFFMPTEAEVASLVPGDLAKLIFRSHPESLEWGGERMWVEVIAWDGAAGTGRLDNKPFDMPQLKLGAIIAFSAYHVISVQHEDPAKTERFRTDHREWWDRCLVDKTVANGERPVGYLYREEPETPEGDTYPDSGWRIRSGEDETDPPLYIALGAVLNKDDSWVHLVDAEVGSVFERALSTGLFEPVED